MFIDNSRRYFNFTEATASLLAQIVKNLPVMQEAWVQSLSRGDPLEKGMVAHSSILAERIPRTEKPGGLQLVYGVAELDTSEQLTHTHFSFHGFKRKN